NAEWSNLALSGLFVEMLRRTVAMSQGVTAAGEGALPPLDSLDGFGRLQHAPPTARPIAAKEIGTTAPSPRHPPGFYGTAVSKRALNLSDGVTELKPIGELPEGVARETFTKSVETDIRPPLLVAAFILALLDLVIAYALRGLLRRRPVGVAAGLLLGLIAVAPAARS